MYSGDQTVYVREGKVIEETLHADGTDSLCDNQSKLDVIPRDQGAVAPWFHGRVTVKVHRGVPSMDPYKLSD